MFDYIWFFRISPRKRHRAIGLLPIGWYWYRAENTVFFRWDQPFNFLFEILGGGGGGLSQDPSSRPPDNKKEFTSQHLLSFIISSLSLHFHSSLCIFHDCVHLSFHSSFSILRAIFTYKTEQNDEQYLCVENIYSKIIYRFMILY
jgi:hypothetical protein